MIAINISREGGGYSDEIYALNQISEKHIYSLLMWHPFGTFLLLGLSPWCVTCKRNAAPLESAVF